MTLCDAAGRAYFGEPRNVLARVVKRFAGLGLDPSANLEIEFHFTAHERAKGLAPQPVAEAAYEEVTAAIIDAATAQGLPPVAIAKRPGDAGQHKIALAEPCDALRAADHAVFLRQVVRAVARRHGLDATFMAKPYRAQPGNAMRVRAAIARGADGNAFAEGASAADENLRAAIGGLQTVMAESIALFAPNANAYRRFAPGGGVARNKRWAYANRTAVLSVEGEGEARCIEHGVPGADANPYLVLAATFAGIHHGIAAGADPGAPFDGDAAAFVDQTLPLNVDAALVALENAAIMREYLGPPYVDLYCATKRAELARFRDHISPHEYDWYL